MGSETIAVNPKDIFNAISGKKSMEEIAAAFGVPMSLLTPENTNRANADAANYAYQRDTIHPRLIMREQKINEKIMPLYDPKLFCMFDNPVMEDNEAVRKKIESGTKIGLFTINESRRMFGEQDSADPNANRRLVPMNYCYADRLDEVIDNSKMKPGDKPGGENNEREE